MDERLTRAGELFERAVFGGESEALARADRELDGVEADLAAGCGAAGVLRRVEEAQASLR